MDLQSYFSQSGRKDITEMHFHDKCFTRTQNIIVILDSKIKLTLHKKIVLHY